LLGFIVGCVAGNVGFATGADDWAAGFGAGGNPFGVVFLFAGACANAVPASATIKSVLLIIMTVPYFPAGLAAVTGVLAWL
jgi:hypothetical protein